MKTKNRILEVARDLFNEKGVGEVSVRMICEAIPISTGNFTYYFNNKKGDKKPVTAKDQVIAELYQRMMGETYQLIAQIPRDRASILFFLESHKKLFQIQIRYKFFYLNLFEVLVKNDTVRKQYQKNARMEKSLAKELLDLYVSKGVLKKGISESQFSRMVHVGQMLNQSWAIDAEINFRGSRKRKMIHYMQMCCGLLEPYLMPESLKEYRRYFEDLEKSNLTLKM